MLAFLYSDPTDALWELFQGKIQTPHHLIPPATLLGSRAIVPIKTPKGLFLEQIRNFWLNFSPRKTRKSRQNRFRDNTA